ncbi:MAG TPA: chemotaxis protein CheW, partial [Azospirillaceae bacterium]|nr:chemotaxis protein CheW [Azospirillaceae bacterium]
DETVMIGMVIDAVREVLSVDHGCIDRVPALLARNGGTVGIEAICRLGDGERLVSVLSADGLLNRATAADAGSGDAEGGDADGEDEQFVVFRLASEEYGVPVADVQEIVRVPDDLTHLPRTASHIEGVVNLRGSVLPVINQRRRFGLPTVERNDRQRIVVLTAGNVRTGIIVDSVTEVLKIARAAIGPAPDRIAGAVSRVANLAAQSRLVLLLEVGRLLEAKI